MLSVVVGGVPPYLPPTGMYVSVITYTAMMGAKHVRNTAVIFWDYEPT